MAKILIVDDEPDMRTVLFHTLRGAGHQVTEAAGGEEALKKIKRTKFDLVLLDIMMPDIDGYEICRRVRAAEPTRELPIMFLSSLEDAQDKARGFEVGGNDYVTKPFEMLEVKARVRSLLKAKSYADAVKESAMRDLRIAREIQTGLLPANIAAQVRGTGLDVYAVLEPAQHVGGDLYEVMRLDHDQVLVAIGDVSGKGVPAALFMAVAMTLLRSMARQGIPLAEILRRMNEQLIDQNPRGLFVTLQCLVFDLAHRSVTCANAGHLGAVCLPAGDTPTLAFESSGLVLGLLPAIDVACETRDLHAGDTFVLYTDGVSEAFDTNGDLFGDERLLAHLCGAPRISVRDRSLGVLDAVRQYAAGAPQSDDITIVSVRYTGSAM